MNRIYIVLGIFLVLFTRCTSPKPKESTLKVPVNVTKQLNSDKPKDSILKVQVRAINKSNSVQFKDVKGVFYSINIDLINNTDSIIQFWIMSCSWDDNFIFNTVKVHLLGWDCNKNSPEICQIAPGQIKTYNVILCIRNNSVIKNHKDVKLGFVLIKKEENLGGGDFDRLLHDKIKREKDIIWSNAFKIKE